VDELSRQRDELNESVRRIGDAFASGLDRSALLEIVAESAVAACEADYARVHLVHAPDSGIEVGPAPGAEARKAQRAAEESALRKGGLAEARRGVAHAMAHPVAPAGDGAEPSVMSVCRDEGPEFSAQQREVLRYLVGQAGVSIENISLHEQVSEQAVTDELTGIANNRALRRWLDTEIDRAGRFGHTLSLLLLDLDDFKQVNDTLGHLQGDEVLRVVGRVLQRESRGIDAPARYGGEEFAVGLPETGPQGAVEVAERIRARLEGTEIPMVEDEEGGTMRVTASIGVATLPDVAEDARGLVAAADEALYRAKAAGKNRVELTSSEKVERAAKGEAKPRRT
jgi:diguanylate cyclase (GGDEF)-like protein